MWGTFCSQLFRYFISINSQVSQHPYQLNPLCSASSTRNCWQSQTNLEFVCKLWSAVMAAWLSLRMWMFLSL
jgi:hypothetical protein